MPKCILTDKELRVLFFNVVPPDEEALLFLCLNPNLVSWSSLESIIKSAELLNSLIFDYGFEKEAVIKYVPHKAQCFIGVKKEQFSQEIE